jgi:hypothetical protein
MRAQLHPAGVSPSALSQSPGPLTLTKAAAFAAAFETPTGRRITDPRVAQYTGLGKPTFWAAGGAGTPPGSGTGVHEVYIYLTQPNAQLVAHVVRRPDGIYVPEGIAPPSRGG